MSSTTPKIDRQTITPFLLKLYYRSGSFHRLDEFTPTSTPRDHLQIYTWPSCSLRELTQLLTSALPSLLPSPAAGTRVAFRLVYPDTRPPNATSAPGRFLSKDLGSVVVGTSGGESEDGVLDRLAGEPERTLADAKFIIGDLVSCAVLPPLANGAVAPPPPAIGGGFAGRGGYGGPPARNGYGGREYGGRENGYGGDGYRGRGGGRGGYRDDYGRLGPSGGSVPSGEWRRGERIPEGPGGGRGGYGGGRGRGRGW